MFFAVSFKPKHRNTNTEPDSVYSFLFVSIIYNFIIPGRENAFPFTYALCTQTETGRIEQGGLNWLQFSPPCQQIKALLKCPWQLHWIPACSSTFPVLTAPSWFPLVSVFPHGFCLQDPFTSRAPVVILRGRISKLLVADPQFMQRFMTFICCFFKQLQRIANNAFFITWWGGDLWLLKTALVCFILVYFSTMSRYNQRHSTNGWFLKSIFLLCTLDLELFTERPQFKHASIYRWI